MDRNLNLNKAEMQEIKRLLENFVESDPTIQLRDICCKVNKECKDELQKLFNEKMGITNDIISWCDKYDICDSNYVYYSDHYGVDHKYDRHRAFTVDNVGFNLEDCNRILINTRIYCLGYRFTDANHEEIVKTYEKIYDKYYEEFEKHKQKFQNIIKEMLIVLSTLKKANKVLEKFGFIESINNYLNILMVKEAKPISLCTQAVENSVDNYLEARKLLDAE